MTSLKQYILGLDFDGVFWDSAGECWLTLTKTLENRGQVVDHNLKSRFLKGRWLVRTGGDFWLVYHLAQQNPDLDFDRYSKEEFDGLREQHKDDIARFTPEFYAQRESTRAFETEIWLGSQPPYSTFIQQYPSLVEQFSHTVLITTKDAASARQLLDTANIRLPIWSRENGLDKGQHVLEIAKTYGWSAEKILLVDDLVENLQQVQRVGARGFLASWGYNNLAERQAAPTLGFPVLEPDDLLGQLVQHLVP